MDGCAVACVVMRDFELRRGRSFEAVAALISFVLLCVLWVLNSKVEQLVSIIMVGKLSGHGDFCGFTPLVFVLGRGAWSRQ